MTRTATAQIGLLLAHQGGWDEILMVAGPLLVVGGLLVLANRRAKAHLAAVTEDAPTPAERDA
ncbi:MAG: hypothetical protein IT196_09090 [Acidimicrobiales bacterium]|nr:hypothetical protein [Acidimicrobiales bacterium]